MAASTTKTRTTRPRAATRKTTPKAVRPVTSTELEPLRLVTPENPPEVEEVELFSIDGRAYMVPREVSPAVSLRFLKAARQVGAELAMGELLEEMLGEEGYDALMNFKYLTQQNLVDLMELVKRHAMGALEGPKGTSRTA